MKRKASAYWTGSLKEGKGTLSTQSTVLNNTAYAFTSRFEDGIGTNPEELIGAAHAGCFTMAFANMLSTEGFVPTALNTEAVVEMDMPTLTITNVHLTVNGVVPGISKEKFEELANSAKKGCVISRLINANITLAASLK